MTYRETEGARRAEREVLEQELEAARQERAGFEQKLARAETALAVYRKSSTPAVTDGAAAGRVMGVVGIVLWASAVWSAIRDSDALAGYLAAAFCGFAAFAPIGVWASLGRLGSGVAITLAKVVSAIAIAGYATGRAAARTDGWVSLFWWGPAVLLVLLVFEAFVLLGRHENHGEGRDRIV